VVETHSGLRLGAHLGVYTAVSSVSSILWCVFHHTFLVGLTRTSETFRSFLENLLLVEYSVTELLEKEVCVEEGFCAVPQNGEPE